MYPKTANRVHVFWGISGKIHGRGAQKKNIKNSLLAMPPPSPVRAVASPKG